MLLGIDRKSKLPWEQIKGNNNDYSTMLPQLSKPRNKTTSIALTTFALFCILLTLQLLGSSLLPSYAHSPLTGVPVQGLDFRKIEAKSPILISNLELIDKLKANSLADGLFSPVVYNVVPQKISPEVVIVTDLDYELYPKSHLEKLVENRKSYAEKHGYGLYCQWSSDFRYIYQNNKGYKHWSPLAMVRAAMHSFPHSKYFVLIDRNTLIMNHEVDIVSQLINSETLDKLMLREQPILKSSDIIKTISHVRAPQVRVIMAQDEIGMNPSAFIMTNCDSSKILLDYWTDQLHRKYERFTLDRQVADSITHIFQWHHSFLRELAVVPSKKLTSLISTSDSHLQYTEGDFLAVFRCDETTNSCPEQMDPYFTKSQ